MNLKNLGTPPEEKPESTEETVEVAEESVIYSSHPILNLAIGQYRFVNGQLKVAPEEAEAFDSLLAGFPGNAGVKKIDLDAAHELALEFLKSRTVRGVDTSEDRPN